MEKILVLDDEEAIRKMLKKLLEKNGYEVITASDGVQGVKLFKEHLPELIITDLIMPEKEGLETIRDLKSIKKDVKIIAISGGGLSDPITYLKLSEKLGASKSFSKPIDNAELLSEVKKLLDE